MKIYDVIVIGAGGAGMMCALETGKRGRKTALLDHTAQVGAKILISGGGRCNFTNIGAGPENYLSQNPHFCKSALSRYSPSDFIALVEKHQIPYHEKKLGQLFCDRSAKDIVEMLSGDCQKAGVEFFLDCMVQKVFGDSPSPSREEGRPVPRSLGEGGGESDPPFNPLTLPSPARGEGFIERNGGFRIETNRGEFSCQSLVIATGGLSIPKVGATDFGYRIARQFGVNMVYPSPALDGFRFNEGDLKRFGDLTGVSLDCKVTCNQASFRENILFTHAGISGPAALQASLYWYSEDPVVLDLLPDFKPGELEKWFQRKKGKGVKSEVKTLLGELIPYRLAERLCDLELPPHANLLQLSAQTIQDFSSSLRQFSFVPHSTIAYSKAEVTRGGVDTDELSSKTMECKNVPGLYFIGEVVDVTGWLGGYNFQWAWSSGYVAGQYA